MAKIQHNKQKVTDAIFVAMVSENLSIIMCAGNTIPRETHITMTPAIFHVSGYLKLSHGKICEVTSELFSA